MLTHLTIDLSTELRICSEQKGIDELKYSPSNRTAVNEEFPLKELSMKGQVRIDGREPLCDNLTIYLDGFNSRFVERYPSYPQSLCESAQYLKIYPVN